MGTNSTNPRIINQSHKRMKPPIKINPPEGYTFSSVDPKTGTINLVEKKSLPIKERIKTFEDILSDQGLEAQDFDLGCRGLSADEIAYRKLKLIAKTLNEGWVPDWNNSSEYKYYPYFNMTKQGENGFACDDYDDWRADSAVGGRLCFKTRDLAIYAGNQFSKEYGAFLG